jgi:hypothetical protein
VHILSALGVLSSVILLATVFYANKQLDDAITESVTSLMDAGNPFALLGVGVSVGPSFGFWGMLIVSIAIAGLNIYRIVTQRKAASEASVVVPAAISEVVPSQPQEPAIQPAPVVQESVGIVADLRGLKELFDSGAISDDEFTRAKKRLLGEQI